MANKNSRVSDSVCNICKNSNNIKDVNFVKCAGLCGFNFHIQCVKIGKREFNSVTSNSKNIKWVCDACECALFDIDGRLTSGTTSGNNHLEDAPVFQKILRKIEELTNMMTTVTSELNNLKSTYNYKENTENIVANSEQEREFPAAKVLSPQKPPVDKHTTTSPIKNHLFKSDTDINKVTDIIKNNSEILDYLLNTDNPTKSATTKANSILCSASNKNEPVRSQSGSSDAPVTIENQCVSPPSTYASVTTSARSGLHKQKEPENKNPPKNVRNPVVGTNDNIHSPHDFKAAPRKAWIHVWNVASGTDETTLRNYMRSKIPTADVFCSKLQSKGNYSSFKVSIDYTLRDSWMQPNMWPKGIVVNRFFHHRPVKIPKP